MKNLSKIIIATIALTLAAGTGYAMSEKFNDYDNIPDWAKSSVKNLSDSNVITGYENGNFGPNDAVTRAQMATILGRYRGLYLTDYSSALMNYGYFENTNLDYEVKTALAIAMAVSYQPGSRIESPNSLNNYSLSDSCNFKDANLEDYGMIKKITSSDIPKSYTVYHCDGDITYGAGYYVHHNYTGGIPGSGGTGTIDAWYGPYAPNILLSK